MNALLVEIAMGGLFSGLFGGTMAPTPQPATATTAPSTTDTTNKPAAPAPVVDVTDVKAPPAEEGRIGYMQPAEPIMRVGKRVVPEGEGHDAAPIGGAPMPADVIEKRKKRNGEQTIINGYNPYANVG